MTRDRCEELQPAIAAVAPVLIVCKIVENACKVESTVCKACGQRVNTVRVVAERFDNDSRGNQFVLVLVQRRGA